MRHSKIDAILELIDGALAGYAAEATRAKPARTIAPRETPGRGLVRAANSTR